MTPSQISSPPHSTDDFEIAILCALPLEADAILCFFDHYWKEEDFSFERAPFDLNQYTFGTVSGHHVVLTHLPGMGKVIASQIAAKVHASFDKLKFALVVGVCGATPRRGSDGEICLGDVIISTGLKQYDFGRRYPGGFEQKISIEDSLGRPSLPIRSLLRKLQTQSQLSLLRSEMASLLDGACQNHLEASYPGVYMDYVFEASYLHQHAGQNKPVGCTCDTEDKSICQHAVKMTCDELGCDRSRTIPRRSTSDSFAQRIHSPKVHFGIFASGDSVMKSAEDRDRIAADETIVGFEMEAAGVWDELPTLVIKGVCDYADSHKSKDWQAYAAFTAAACMKICLSEWPRLRRSNLPPRRSQREEESLRSLAFIEMNNRYHDISDAMSDTCQWILTHNEYISWLEGRRRLLWISGVPGAGKSVATKFVLGQSRDMLRREQHALIYFFYNGKGGLLEHTPLGFYRAVLHQLATQCPEFLNFIAKIFQEKCRLMGECGVKWNWHQDELRRLLLENVRSLCIRYEIRIIADALDESGGREAQNLVLDFQKLLEATEDSGMLSICFSCRHYPILEVDDALRIKVESENIKDIQLFVNSRLGNQRHFEKDDRLIEEIIANSRGVFQWVALVVDRVLLLRRKRRPERSIRSEIRLLPRDLHLLYDKLLQELVEEGDENEIWLAMRLFEWLCFAIEPLSIGQLFDAMVIPCEPYSGSLQQCHIDRGFADDETSARMRVRDLSRGLAEVVEHNGMEIPQLIHQSVHDHLLEQGLNVLDSSSPVSVVTRGRFRLSRICLNTFSLTEVQAMAEKLDQEDSEPEIFRDIKKELSYNFNTIPFLQYAMVYLEEHLSMLKRLDMLQTGLMRFDWPTITYTFASLADLFYEYYERYNIFKRGPTFLHIAAMFGLLAAAEEYISHNFPNCPDIDKWLCGSIDIDRMNREAHGILSLLICLNARDLSNHTPLHYAVKSGSKEMVLYLLGFNGILADVATSQNKSPLAYALSKGEIELVKILLTRVPNIALKKRVQELERSSEFCGLNEDSRKVLEMLKCLASGVNPLCTYYFGTTLEMCVLWFEGPERNEALELLIDTGRLDPDIMTDGGPVLTQAISTSLDDRSVAIECLLQTGRVDPLRRWTDVDVLPFSAAVACGTGYEVSLLECYLRQQGRFIPSHQHLRLRRTKSELSQSLAVLARNKHSPRNSSYSSQEDFSIPLCWPEGRIRYPNLELRQIDSKEENFNRELKRFRSEQDLFSTARLAEINETSGVKQILVKRKWLPIIFPRQRLRMWWEM